MCLQGKVILCLTCYKNFNKFVRSDDSLNELSKTDDYLTKCCQFDQVEYCNVDSDNLDRYCFYPVLEFVVREFLSNKPLLLPDLYKKFEDLFDKTASQSVFFPLFAHDMKKIKQDSNWLFRMLKCSLGPSLLHFVPRQKKMGRMLYRNGTNFFAFGTCRATKGNIRTDSKQ